MHTGDLTVKGTFQELQIQIDWLDKQLFQHKIVIAGNHDLLLDPTFVERFPERIIERPGSSCSDLQWKSVIYLQDQSYSAAFSNGRQLKIYGSPWTTQFGNWAFQYPEIRDVFQGRVPSDTDILLTHGPPERYLDSEMSGFQMPRGSRHLLKEIWRVRESLKLVVFGHIHGGYGTEVVRFDRLQRTYDMIHMGISGFRGLFIMMLSLILSWLSRLSGFGAGQQKRKDIVRLVNAAVQPAPGEPGSKQPLAFQI